MYRIIIIYACHIKCNVALAGPILPVPLSKLLLFVVFLIQLAEFAFCMIELPVDWNTEDTSTEKIWPSQS